MIRVESAADQFCINRSVNKKSSNDIGWAIVVLMAIAGILLKGLFVK